MNRHSAASLARSRRRSAQVGRGHPIGIEVERGRVESRAPDPGRGGGIGQGLGHRLVRPVRRLPEVPCPGVRGRTRRRQRGMRATQLGGRRETEHGLGHQRVAEPDRPTLDPDEARVDGRLEFLREPRSGSLERLERWLGRGCGEEHGFARGHRERGDAAGHERPERVRDRQRDGRVRRVDVGRQGAPDLERVQRVARGRGLDLDQHQPRQRPAESLPEHLVEGRERQRTQPDPLGLLGRHGGRQVGRTLLDRSGPDRDEQAERAVREPPDGIGDDGRRALVEPLRVVDGDEDRRADGQRAEQAGDRDGQRPLVGQVPGRLDPQEGDLERVALRVRAGSARTDASTSANRSVRPPRVRPCSERAGPEVRTVKPAAAGEPDGRVPDGRLADARLALEDERREPSSSTLHESFDCRELIPAADDLVRHGRPRFPVRPRTRRPSRVHAVERRYTRRPDSVPAPAEASGAPTRSGWVPRMDSAAVRSRRVSRGCGRRSPPTVRHARRRRRSRSSCRRPARSRDRAGPARCRSR